MSSSQHLHPAERLRRVREALQLSQRELAKEFQVTSGAISLWEMGSRPIPGPVIKLIDLYEASLFKQEEQIQHISQLECFRELKDSLQNIGRPFDPVAMQNIRDGIDSFVQDSWNTNRLSGKIKILALQRLILSLRKSKGVSMKIAQLASFMEIGLSSEVRMALGTLQSSGDSMSAKDIHKIIQEDYGQTLHKVFNHWDSIPLATTSMGQVHKAQLPSGEWVAVKIQHPDIANILRTQFRNIAFVKSLSSLLHKNDGGILEELQRRVGDECDYFQEAKFQEKFRTCFAQDSRVIIPKVFHEYTRPRVLVTEYIQGESFYNFAGRASQEIKNEMACVILDVLMQACFRHGLAHCDLHPSNFLFHEGKVVLLDYGRVLEIKPARLEVEKKFFTALLHQDRELVRELVQELGFAKKAYTKDAPDQFDFDELWNFLMNSQSHLSVNGNFRFTREYIERLAREGRRFAGRHHLQLRPDSFWSFVFRSSCWGLLADLNAECNWRKLAIEFFQSV